MYIVRVYDSVERNACLLLEYKHRTLQAAKRRLSTLLKASSYRPNGTARKAAAWALRRPDNIGLSPATWARQGAKFIIVYPDGIERSLHGLQFRADH